MAKEISPEVMALRKEALRKYVSDAEGNFFVLMNLGGMGIAGAAYARYSRASGGFRETFTREFLDDNGDIIPSKVDVLERILLEFGDDSVGELEGAHSSWEKISNLATKKIEDKRIGGSPIEQSSRYVVYDMKDEKGRWSYLREQRIMQSRFADDYTRTMDFLFESYVTLINGLRTFFETLTPIEEFKTKMKVGNEVKEVTLKDLTSAEQVRDFKRTYNFVMKTSSCDRARVVLPAATLTNLGIFGNGRFYQNLLTALYSEDLAEMQDIAAKQHEQLNKLIEPYVKRSKRDEYLVNTRRNMTKLATEILKGIEPEKSLDVVAVDFATKDLERDIIAQALFKYSRHPIHQLRRIVNQFSREKQLEIFNAYIGDRRTRRDRPGRALEVGYPLSFEIISDFGVYRDLHRHRMLTQERQNLTASLGHMIPNEIVEAGFKEIVEECYSRARLLYERLLDDYSEEAQYATCFGHNIRFFQGMNPREAMHMWELRTTPQGHPNYRKICQKMHNLTREKFPLVAEAMKFVDYEDYTHARADSEARIQMRLAEYRRRRGVDVERVG